MNYIALRDLDRAESHGIKLFDSEVGTFATSKSDPDRLYRVSGGHCDCKGFEHRGHCKHYALLVARVADEALAYFGL